ncbi:MAG: phoR [Firmicutes bacterium]|nr:phoR [Bacillota bacterium]
MKYPLRRKILYSIMAVIFVVLAGVSVGISVLIRDYYLVNKQQELQRNGYELAKVVNAYYDGEINQSQLNGFINSVDDFLDARVWVIDSSRNLLVMSDSRFEWNKGRRDTAVQDAVNTDPNMPNQRTQGFRRLISELDAVYAGNVLTKTLQHPFYGEDFLLVAVPFLKTDGTMGGAVVLNTPVRGINGVLWRIYFYIAIAGGLGLLLAYFIARRLTLGIVRPLQAMQETAGAMSRGDYNTRMVIHSGDELEELGRSLNTLAHDLGEFVKQTAQTEKLRRDFIANVSHELRTPVTVIRGYTEAFLDGTIRSNEMSDKYHTLMRDETVRLERLIHDLLDLSRLQAENTIFETEAIPLPAIADSVVMMLRQHAKRKNIEMTLNVASAIPDIEGNGDRLTQLLLILLDNALKYTAEGGKVTLTIFPSGDGVHLQVADTGAGIPEEDLPFIWERFYKVDKSHSRTEVGTGLGLAIAKEIMDRHGAKVSVASEKGKGTTFDISFPVLALS